MLILTKRFFFFPTLPPCHIDKINNKVGIKNPKPYAHTMAVVFKHQHPVKRLWIALQDLEIK
jgi:hypothetical protein